MKTLQSQIFWGTLVLTSTVSYFGSEKVISPLVIGVIALFTFLMFLYYSIEEPK